MSRLRQLIVSGIIALTIMASSVAGCRPQSATLPESEPVCEYAQVEPEEDGRDIYFFATPFLPDQFYEMALDLENDPAKFEGYSVHVDRVSSVDELKDAIREAYEENGNIDGMILYAHGTTPSIVFSRRVMYTYQVLSMQTAKTQLEGYDAYFSDDARLLLYSCLTGAESSTGNIAEVLHEVLDVDVDAPKSVIVHSDEFLDHFMLDEDGLLAFNYNEFRLYDTIFAEDTEGSTYFTAIASLRFAEDSNNLIHEGEYTIEDMFLRLR